VSAPRRRTLHRRGVGIEFDRVANFSDAVFAIALTLLVVTIEVPSVKDSELPDALRELWPQIRSFFIGFAVIAFYWFGHHTFFKTLRAVDGPFMFANLAYLATIAFIPFPVALVGEHGEVPVAVAIFAVALAAASAMDTVLFVVADRRGLMRVPMGAAARRWSIAASTVPAAVFLLSAPVAYLNPGLAMVSWLLIVPAERFLESRRPADATWDRAEQLDDELGDGAGEGDAAQA
jgi:uncharacterized membrane protein